MSSIIQVENLSKSFTIHHEGKERYTALRDVVAGKAKKLFSFPKRLRPDVSRTTSEEFWALKDVSFNIEQGDRIGIIGRNGAGKSTLLKILSRITEPTRGSIKIKGRVASLLEVGTGFHPELTGRENIYLNGAILGMSRSEIKKKFDEIVDFAEVEKFLDTPVKRYSSGMYVRLAFAVAAHLEPEILVIDEVLAVGDVQFQKKCLGKMEDVSTREGRTILFVSHDMSTVNRICNKAILLDKGQVKKKSTVDNIVSLYASSHSSENEVFFENELVNYLSIKQEEDKLLIICRYKGNKLLKIPCLGFVIYDSLNRPIFGTNPIYQPPIEPLTSSKEGEIQIIIEYPKLLNGTYLLSVWFGDGVIDYFERRHILSFEVVNMVRYEKETYAHLSGPVSPFVKWIQN